MRKILFYIFLFASVVVSSQTSFDYATQPNSSEEALGFVKYNTFTILFSSNRIAGSTSIQRQRVLGLNNDKSIKFDKVIYTGSTAGLIQCSPTYDKGMLTLSGINQCLGGIGLVTFSKLTRIDSIGNVVFSVPPFGNMFRGVVQPSPTRFFYGNINQVVSFNGSTGASFAAVYTTTGNIITLNTTPSQQIIVSTNSVVALIDTLGNLIISKPSSANYTSIKAHKNTFYGLREGSMIIDKMDSVLTVVNSLNATANETITDFSMYKDSMAVSFYNSLTDLSSIKVFPINTLSSPISFSNNIVKHKIIALQRDSTYNILSSERRTSVKALNAGYMDKYSMGFTRRPSLSDLSYSNDIVLTRIKTQSFSISGSYNIDCVYQNSLIVKNNSSKTINSFHVSHPINTLIGWGSSNCGDAGYFNSYDTNVVVNLLPNDSVEIQLRVLYQRVPEHNYPLNLCYDLSVPNNCLENNILNSSACIVGKSIPIPIYTDFLFPNPATNILTISSAIVAETYTIFDTSGRIILLGKESNTIDISTLSCGIYIISYKLNGENFSKKFVKL